MTTGFGNAEVISGLDKSSCNGIFETQGVHKGLGSEKVKTTGTGQTVAQSKCWQKYQDIRCQYCRIIKIPRIHPRKRGTLLSKGVYEDELAGCLLD